MLLSYSLQLLFILIILINNWWTEVQIQTMKEKKLDHLKKNQLKMYFINNFYTRISIFGGNNYYCHFNYFYTQN